MPDKVYMGFMQREGWHVYFMLHDLNTHLLRKLTFAAPEKIVEMAERGSMDAGLEARGALEHGISVGRGGIWLSLSDERYSSLK